MKPLCRILSLILMGWGVSALAAGPYKLEFKYSPGSLYNYKTAATLEVRNATLPGGKTVITEEFIEASKVLSVDADGAAEMESITSALVQTVNGKNTQATSSMLTKVPKDVPILQKISKYGRVLDARPGAANLALADRVKVSKAIQGMKEHGFELPEKAVPVGGSWSSEEILTNAIPGLGDLDIKLKFSYTLVGEEQALGVTCVKIQFSGSGTGVLERGRGDMVIQIKGTLWFAPDKGKLISEKSEETEKLTLAGPNGRVEFDQIATATVQLLP